MPSMISHISNLYKSLGFKEAVGILFRRLLKIGTAVASGPHKLLVRPLESDLFVYGQVFGAREYNIGETRFEQITRLCASLIASGKVPVIVDGGGNVGYSAVYFAVEFPLATIISIEPDPETFRQLKSNCASFSNIIAVHGAVWSHNAGVSLGNTDASSWARTVNDGGLTPSFTIESLLEKVPNGVAVILKLDIEGAEYEVIEHSAPSIREVPCILIEPHDFIMEGKNSIAPLFSVLAGRHIDTILNGENIMFFDTEALAL